MLCTGETVVVKRATVCEQGDWLVFETEHALYRFNRSSVLYYVTRRKDL